VITVPNRYGQTDRRTISNLNTALCTKVHRAVKTERLSALTYEDSQDDEVCWP